MFPRFDRMAMSYYSSTPQPGLACHKKTCIFMSDLGAIPLKCLDDHASKLC